MESETREEALGASTECWSVTGPSWREEDPRGLYGQVTLEHFEQRNDMI